MLFEDSVDTIRFETSMSLRELFNYTRRQCETRPEISCLVGTDRGPRS